MHKTCSENLIQYLGKSLGPYPFRIFGIQPKMRSGRRFENQHEFWTRLTTVYASNANFVTKTWICLTLSAKEYTLWPLKKADIGLKGAKKQPLRANVVDSGGCRH